MARIQILELLEGADDERPPFVLVIDQVPTGEAAFEALRRDLNGGDIAERIGARAVLVFEDTIDIPANWVATSSDGGLDLGSAQLRVDADLAGFEDQVATAIINANRRAAEVIRSGGTTND
ncbi:hypothetical protein [Streptomyces sp. SAJ15]|uniref:hypothetical protein n=1 Tax=Streptomyces sp. SAJ15 TaxID=2011095 RepID=UPI0011871546|nr:hypothetical protein [Streptomyces sp. SAJ15]TVL89754.1 hypothetical protein CD790_25495 [Streptomyces sp. SAJ15]